MQYKSIIRFFEHCDIAYADGVNTGRAKKILSAEFSVAQDGIITIDGFDYSKNDVLEELESADFTEHLRYHALIWKNKSLLDCLEQNTVSFEDIPTWRSLKNDAGFVHFVSPYFAVTFDKIMGKILSYPVNFHEAERWLRLLAFVGNPVDEERALTSLRIFLLDTIKLLKNVNNSTYKNYLPQITPWAEQSSATFLNKLPDSLYKIREDLVDALINFTCLIQKTNRNLCYQISYKLTLITEINEATHNLIHDNHVIIAQNNGKSSKGGSGCGRNVWIGVLIFASLVRLIAGINSCNNSSNKNKYQYDVSKAIETVAYVDFTADYFKEFRNTYTTISPSMFDSACVNCSRKLSANAMHYIMLDRRNTNRNTSIDIVNNSANYSLKIYIMDKNNLMKEFVISKGEAAMIQIGTTDWEDMDFAFRLVDENKTENKPFIIRSKTTATLVSDTLDSTYRTLDVARSGEHLNVFTINPKYTEGVTLVVYSGMVHKTIKVARATENQSDTINSSSSSEIQNYMTFLNAEWCNLQ